MYGTTYGILAISAEEYIVIRRSPNRAYTLSFNSGTTLIKTPAYFKTDGPFDDYQEARTRLKQRITEERANREGLQPKSD